MADGNLVRQSGTEKGAVVFGPSVYDVPLLPYEKELIKTIGITEEEYCKFAAEVRRKGLVRPAEYDHIPDIQAGDFGVSALISLAISLVLTGAAYLLTPKPKAPEASKRTQLDLGSTTAANRFTPSRGFDTLNELADYGSPIPIIFGLYDEDRKIGGMLVTPKLVWSRMFSHGTQQSAKLMYVVGETGHVDGVGPDGIIEPDLEGIFLGNNALDVLYEDFFAFYWKRNSPIQIDGLTASASGFNRLRFVNLFYGTSGAPSKGDPGIYNGPNEDVFNCPNNRASQTPSFCHAFSPTNNTQFGIYGAIPNGNGYRVNYEVVSIIDGTENKQAHVLTLRRIKIVGAKGEAVNPGDEDQLKKIRKQDMEGEGRQYSPRMGLTRLTETNGTVRTVGSNQLTETFRAKEGDEAEFEIDPGKIPDDFYQRSNNRGGENVDDINSTVASEQIAADEAMQIGEKFAIGNTTWIVSGRTLERYDPDINKVQKIRLRCIDNNESQQQVIGLVDRRNVINPPNHFIADEDGVDPDFYPITRIATGIVRNNKPAVVTEIGIRSKVFQRLNGLCAFNNVPTTDELDDFDDEEVQVRSGTYTGTIIRSSVFRVFVREAGVDNNGNAFRFQRMDPYFVVRGSKPVDQYNFIRFVHPSGEAKELEYKFVPLPASEVRPIDDDQVMIQLFASIPDTTQEVVYEKVSVSNLGTFEIEAAGFRIKKRDIEKNKEFLRKPSASAADGTTSLPSGIKRDDVRPAVQSGVYRRAISMREESNLGNLEPPGRMGAFTYAIFGNPDTYPGGAGTQRSLDTREVFGNRWIRVKWTVSKNELPTDHYARVGQNQVHVWGIVSAQIIGSSPGFSKNDKVEFKRGQGATSGTNAAYPSSNPFRDNHPSGSAITFSGFAYRITDVDTTSAPEGRHGGYMYDIFGDAEGRDIGSIDSTIRSVTKGSKKIRFRLNVVVQPLPAGHFTGLTRKWEFAGPIEVINDGFTTSNWNKGEHYEDLQTISAANNPFYWTFDRVGFEYEITELNLSPGVVQLTGETEFESRSQYADISFYRGLVQKSNESEPEHSIVYVNEILPNNGTPQYNGLTLAGLSLKASRNFTSLDQMRCWLAKGLTVKRLHPDLGVYGKSGDLFHQSNNGPSNLFTDLVFFLLTDKTAGAGNLLRMDASNTSLLNVDDFKETSRFLHRQELFFNGVIVEQTNLRQYITDVAPYFLCNFVIMDGKFSLLPAIPHYPASGEINTGPLQIDQLFTAGNILEDSYKLEYLRSEERRAFKAVVRYRHESRNKLPEERVIQVRLNGESQDLPEEQFDLTQFCTSRGHAVKVAQYFLALRKFVTHTISFSTTVHGLNLRAGSFIKVITESSPYSSANNGTVSASGAVTSVKDLPDGMYDVSFFQSNSEDVEEAQMQVSGGRVADSRFHDSVFTVQDSNRSENVYVVEQLTFSQEGTVDIVASEHNCTSSGASEIAKLVADSNSVVVEDT